MENNIWQLLMMWRQKMEEEEEKRRMQAARNLSNGAHDGGMSLEQMFRRYRPTLMDAWEGGQAQPPYNKPQMPQMTFGNPAVGPEEQMKFPMNM